MWRAVSGFQKLCRTVALLCSVAGQGNARDEVRRVISALLGDVESRWSCTLGSNVNTFGLSSINRCTLITRWSLVFRCFMDFSFSALVAILSFLGERVINRIKRLIGICRALGFGGH